MSENSREPGGIESPGTSREPQDAGHESRNLDRGMRDPCGEGLRPQTLPRFYASTLPRGPAALASHESPAARATSDEIRATAPAPCGRCCANCRCVMALENEGQTWLACPNRPGRLGQLTVVQPCDSCRDFEPKSQAQGPADEGTRFIPLVNIDGLCAMVDPADYEWLRQYTWYAECNRGGSYACTYCRGKRCPMHRMLMNTPAGLEVDHKNRNGLDNHRVNLRNCTHAQNCSNRRSPGGVSQFRGVTPRSKKWEAWIGSNGRVQSLGCFSDPVEAARVRDRKAIELHGEFAYLNFPEEARGRIVSLGGTIRARSRVRNATLEVARSPAGPVRRRGQPRDRGAGLHWGPVHSLSTFGVPRRTCRLCDVKAWHVLAAVPCASPRGLTSESRRETFRAAADRVIPHATPGGGASIRRATALVLLARPPNDDENRALSLCVSALRHRKTAGTVHPVAAAEVAAILCRYRARGNLRAAAGLRAERPNILRSPVLRRLGERGGVASCALLARFGRSAWNSPVGRLNRRRPPVDTCHRIIAERQPPPEDE